MYVTQIQPLDKKRSRVWLDEEFAFVLYKGELRRFKIEEGSEISESDLGIIKSEILPKRAKLRAMNLLKSRSYSVKQLRDKLKEGYYPPEIIDIAIEYVSGYGYLDDLRIAEEYIRIHLTDKSRMRIKQDLIRKGISGDVIEKAFSNCEEEGFEQDEIAQAKKLLEKKGYDSENISKITDRAELARLGNFLLRKGFSTETVRAAMGYFHLT